MENTPSILLVDAPGSAPGSAWHACVSGAVESARLGTLHLEQTSDMRRAGKRLRRLDDAAALVAVVTPDTLDDFLTLCRTLRKVMHQTTLRILVCRDEELAVEDLDLITEHGVDTVLDESCRTPERVLAQLGAYLRTYRDFRDTRARQAVENDLLTALARFSRAELTVSECLAEFTRNAARISGAVLANAVLVRRDGRLHRSRIADQAADLAEGAADKLIAIEPVPARPLLARTAQGGRLSVSLDESARFYRDLGELIGVPLGGSFAFPLKSFTRTLCIVECFLPAGGLDQVTVDLVNLIEKSSEQFGILLERFEAEARLRKQYERMKETLSELSETREALYHSEKLAAVGQLAAGIAHEINNPIAFVLSNFSPLDEYLGCMTRLLGLHGEFVAAIDKRDEAASRSLRSSLDDVSREIDVDFMLEDVRSLVSESREGLLRVKDIVVNLNQFARKDALDVAPADINDGLAATLRILQPQLAPGIAVTCDYGPLPPICCNLGLLNQVFLNILQNASQALGEQGTIRISTWLDGEHAWIAIRDDGPGMPADVREHIFDPFYTTKEVGAGTGLGLSMSHGIVTRHGGRIEVDSAPGEGSEFRIVLPTAGIAEDLAEDDDAALLASA